VTDVTDRMTVALFPGQGSLTPSAHHVVAERRPDLLERCAELVGDDPFARAAESTAYAQPAIFCASLAGWGLVDRADILAVAGHSLGELTALVAGGVLSEDDGLRLVVLRGRLMAEAAQAAPGGTMLALLGGTPADAHELAREQGVTVANDNAPGQTVLAGAAPALRNASAAARERGIRAVRLDVAGAFHSPAMAPAEQAFLRAVRDTPVRDAEIAVFCSTTASLFVSPALELARALTRPVRWRETMTALSRFGANRFIDVGPGHVLARLVERNVPGASAVTTEDLDGLAA
jgi:acyl transferase domain-containing protein